MWIITRSKKKAVGALVVGFWREAKKATFSFTPQAVQCHHDGTPSNGADCKPGYSLGQRERECGVHKERTVRLYPFEHQKKKKKKKKGPVILLTDTIESVKQRLTPKHRLAGAIIIGVAKEVAGADIVAPVAEDNPARL